MRKFGIYFIFSFCFFDIYGQYKAPILTCVSLKGSSNEIKWLVPNETCGPFQNFEIFVATNKSGPYTLLTTITNINTTSFIHTSINTASTYYYFMTSKFNCAGSSANSDTLDNKDVPPPTLLSVSIENNFPVYKWIPIKDNKKIWAYVLINFGNVFVDTVIGREKTDGIDSTFNASSGVYTSYTIGSLDTCVGVGGYSNVRHRPVFLSLVSNPCEDEVEISWTKYQGWGPNDEVKNFEVYIKKNSGNEELVATTDSSIRTFRYKDFLFGDTLCIRIKATHPTDPAIHSFSNQLCFVSSKTQVPELLQPLSASYIDNYKTNIRWFCSLDAIPKSFDLLIIDPRSDGVIRTLMKVKYTTNGKGYYSFLDSFGESSKSIAYRVRYEDLCNNKSTGGQVITNFLTVSQIGLYKNEIKWPKTYFHDSILYSKLKYELYFSINGGSYMKIAEPNISSNSFEHNVEEFYQTEGKFCYKLVVHYKLDTLKPVNDSIFSMASPYQCMDMRTVLWMPNAFKLNGVTPVFKPKIYFFNSTQFSMKIFNRWGRQIFETNDVHQGWNGTMDNGQQASEDSYVYLISYIGNDGVRVEKTGTFTLLK